MTGRYLAYPEYKSTDEVWLGSIPKHWRSLKINRLTQIKRGASPRPIEDPKYFDENGEYAWVRIADVSASDTYLESSTQQLSSLGASLSVKLEPNELFLSIAGTVGKPCINKIKACIHDGFVYFPELKENSKFIFYIFAAGEAYKGLGKFGTQLNLNTETVGGIKIGIPCLDEQNKIVNFLDHETAKIDTLIAKQEKLIKLLKEKRQAVISHAVTRGLNPNAPMKDSGVEWLGEVPKHWGFATVRRFLLEHRQGYYTTESYVDEGTKLLRITDLRNLGEISTLNCPQVPDHSTLHNYYLKEGDVVFARTGGAGSFGVVPKLSELVAYASYLIRFRFIPKHFNTDYLRFMLVADSFQLAVKRNIHGGVNQNIHAEDIKDTFVCCPPLNEQQKISSYLNDVCDKYEILINKATSAIELMKERKTALISAAVTGKIDVRNWSQL